MSEGDPVESSIGDYLTLLSAYVGQDQVEKHGAYKPAFPEKLYQMLNWLDI